MEHGARLRASEWVTAAQGVYLIPPEIEQDTATEDEAETATAMLGCSTTGSRRCRAMTDEAENT